MSNNELNQSQDSHVSKSPSDGADVFAAVAIIVLVIAVVCFWLGNMKM